MADRPETQEQSIKARKSQLFDPDEKRNLAPKIVRKPFAELLRETPSAPLSVGTKGLLWTLGVVVLALLGLALASGGKPKPKPTGKSSFLPVVSTSSRV